MFLSRRQSGALSLATLLCALVAGPHPAAAQSGWSDADIGNPSLWGSSWNLEGFHGLIGAGADVSGTFDQLHFTFHPASGDVDVSACVELVHGADPALSVGLMIRESLDPGARATSVLFSPDKGVALQARGTPGAPVAVGDYSAAMPPLCLRLVRRANVFTAYRSDDRRAWAAIGETNVEMPAATVVGLALSSHGSFIKAQAMFSEIALSAPSPGDHTPAPHPAPVLHPTSPSDPAPASRSWGALDLWPTPDTTPTPDPGPTSTSDPALPLDSTQSPVLPAPWLVKDIGAPFWGLDVYAGEVFTLSGAGVGIRGNSDQFHFVYQPVQGDIDVVAQVISLNAAGGEGTTGIMIRESMTPNATTVFAGITNQRALFFLHRPFEGATAVQTQAPGWPWGPVWVRLVRQGGLFTALWSADRVTWTVMGSQTVPMATRVYVGLPVSSGQSSILATAMLTDWSIAHPEAGGGDHLPVVDIGSPAVSTSFEPQEPIVIRATAFDPDGSIVRVDFYAGGTRLGSDTSAPYEFTWSAATAGIYNLTAMAFDNAGGASVSVPVQIVVALGSSTIPAGPLPDPIPPVLKVPIGLGFTPSPDHDSGVISYVIDLHREGDAITSTPLVTTDLGKPSVSNGQIEINIDSTVDQVAGGTYYIVLRAVGPGGASPYALSSLFSK